MSKQHLFGLILLLLIIAIGFLAPNGFGSASASLPHSLRVADWGEPCPIIHDTACYSGSNESSAQRRVGMLADFGIGQANLSSDPLAVELVCINAQGDDGQVMIEWETATEFDTIGFYVERSFDTSDFETISEFIPYCDITFGGYYLFQDFDVTNGNAYHYRVREVESAVKFNYHPDEEGMNVIPGSFTATPTSSPTDTPVTPEPSEQPDQPTNTPTPSPTNTPGPSPTSSRTPTPSQTGQPTATSARSASVSPTPTRQLGSTFTPTPAGPGPTNTPLPTATRRVTATNASESTGAGSVGEGNPRPTNTPQVVAQVGTPEAGYPAPLEATLEPGAAPPTAYPGPVEQYPTATPFPADYVPPPTRQPFQLATMTPAYPIQATDSTTSQDGASGLSPRVWLYVGFVFSLLLLVGGLLAMLRRGSRSAASAANQGMGVVFPVVDDSEDTEDGA